MNAESIPLWQLLDGCGRNDISTAFWGDDEYDRSSVKWDEREKVADFLISAVSPQTNLVKLLSFPGVVWSFEAYLRGRISCQFIGLERNKTTYRKSARAIPGPRTAENSHHTRRIEKSLPFGKGSITYSRVNKRGTRTRNTRANRLLLMDAETYSGLMFADCGASAAQKLEFADRFYCRNAVWLDFTSQLCTQVESTLSRLPYCLERPDFPPYKKPVVITVMNARDSYHGSLERIARILQIQPQLEYVNHWTYIGKGGVSMLTGCFLMI